jgi:hypothetical protein
MVGCNGKTNRTTHKMKNIRLMQRLLIIMGLVIVILGLGTCYGVMKDKANSSLIEDLEGELLAKDQRFIERIKEDSTREYTQNQLLSTERNARILAEDEAKRFKKISQVTKVNVKVEKEPIVAEYTNYPQNLSSNDTAHASRMQAACIPIGTEFAYQTKWDTIQGKVDSTGIAITKNVTNLGELTTIVGYEKQGLFKKSKPVVLVTTENPSVRITSMSNVVVKHPKPKRLGWLISGIAIGITGGILLMAN